MGRTWGEHVVYKNCSECQKQFLYTTCSMNNLSSYCRLVDAKIRASDKDLAVKKFAVKKTPTVKYVQKNNNIKNC